MNTLIAWFQRRQLGSLVLLALVLFVVFPLGLDTFRLNLVGKYLTYAFVAVGLVMVWGYGGVLSLGQGVFFGLGGYAMAMFLKLEASDPESTKIQSTPGIPDFMDWNQITELPSFWVPFKSFPFALAAVELPEGLVVLGQVADGFGVDDIKVGDEVELAGPLGSVRLRQIESHRAGIAELGGERFDTVLAAGDQHQPRAGGGKLPGEVNAEAGRGAGDENDR